MTDHSTPQDDADAADPTRQKLESLFKMLRGSDGPTPGDSNSVSQRFRLLRRHASGGLGDIWIAQDEELNREVALKEIQPQFAGHEQSWSRFLREATITGQLEHPGIVPIYALGRHENGQPFYAMRFVQGDTLADAIAKFHRREDAAPPPTERNLQRRKLITRLIDVCNAVAYAHSRSIIHRDLKPANIMLGEFGETLVVDWGLAKSLAEVADETQPPAANVAESLRDSDDTSCGATRLRETPPTQMGSAIGSPPYMSPEQAAGRLDELGPASDIYSLGATLFELLTGQSPIGAAPAGEPRETLSIKDLLQRIQEGHFPRPSAVTPDVPRALEAVCLKAMSLRPEDRYASARDLASDLEAWLADEPVTAWTEPLTIRARRWMRRHQTVVVSTVATALVAIVALSVLAFVVTDRNERLATAKGNLEHSNNQLAETNRELATSNQREREQTNLATQRADELAKANQQVKAEAENAKRSQASTAAVLQFFSEKVLAAARPVSDGGLGFDATIRSALDAAEPQIGATFKGQPLVEVIMRTVLGRTYKSLGEAALAIRQFERCRELFSAEYGPDHEITLAITNDLASEYRANGKLDMALPLFEQTLEKRKTQLGSDHRDTLISTNNLGLAYMDAGKLELALPLLEQTLDKTKEKVGPDDPETLISVNNLGLAYKEAGRLDQALLLYEEALEIAKKTLGPEHRATLSTMNNLASAYEAIGKGDLAVPLFEWILEKRVATLAPDHPDTLLALTNLAHAYQVAGKLDKALPLSELAVEKRRAKLGADHPDTLFSMNNLAFAYEEAGRFEQALPLYEETLKMRQAKLGSEHPATLITLGNLAGTLLRTRQPERAVLLFKQFIRAHRQKLTPTPGFSGILASVSLDLLQFQQYAEAERYLRECLAIRENAQPNDWSTFNTKSMLGGSLLGQKKYADSEPLLIAGYEGMRQREADIPAQGKIRLTEAIQRLVDLYDATDQKDKATAWRAKLAEQSKEKGQR